MVLYLPTGVASPLTVRVATPDEAPLPDTTHNDMPQELEQVELPPSTPGTLSQLKRTESVLQRNQQAEITFNQSQTLKKMPEFGSLVESIVADTLTNIIQEAFQQEFNITARPRMIALPPRVGTPRSQFSAASRLIAAPTRGVVLQPTPCLGSY